MKPYKILMHYETYHMVMSYKQNLEYGEITSGSYLHKSLKGMDFSLLTVHEFIELLMNTKRPKIFAESAVHGDGTDWNQAELSVLGDICIAVPVMVYDNGRHNQPEVHDVPFSATLLYAPGALLKNGKGNIPADWDEVTTNNQINSESFYSLYERRLLPAFIYANDTAEANNKIALITIPGLGCGQFAGEFRGQLGSELKTVLIKFIKTHSDRFPNIRVVYYDPYKECENERHEIEHISFLIRPLTKGNDQKTQLCDPRIYEELDDDFNDCELFSFVAWDHVSWPGNDFFTGSRLTDDGVKAAATSSMAVITGVEGSYNVRTNKYNPPVEYVNWEDVVRRNNIRLQVSDNLDILPTSP